MTTSKSSTSASSTFHLNTTTLLLNDSWWINYALHAQSGGVIVERDIKQCYAAQILLQEAARNPLARVYGHRIQEACPHDRLSSQRFTMNVRGKVSGCCVNEKLEWLKFKHSP